MRRSVVVLGTLVITLAASARTPAAQNASKQPSLPELSARQACPLTEGTYDAPTAAYMFGGPIRFGSGPVYVDFAWRVEPKARFSFTDISNVVNGVRRATPAKTPWVAEPSFAGTIEVRGRSLRADRTPLTWRSDAGSVETLRLTAPNVQAPGQWSFWGTGMEVPGPGCYGLQIEAGGRSQVVVFEVT